MAEISTIARPYAEALFRVAAEGKSGGDLNAWADVVADLSAVASDPAMRELISDPKVSDGQVYAVFVGAIKSELKPEAQNFLRALIANDRLAAMPEIAAQFHALKNAKEGTADAEITSAFAMNDAQVADLVAALEKKFKVKLKAAVTVDKSLIGGVRVVVGDAVLDTSVRARLDAMRAALVA